MRYGYVGFAFAHRRTQARVMVTMEKGVLVQYATPEGQSSAGGMSREETLRVVLVDHRGGTSVAPISPHTMGCVDSSGMHYIRARAPSPCNISAGTHVLTNDPFG